MWTTLTLFLVVVVTGTVVCQDYCKLCSDHTLCIYKSPGPKCQPLIKKGLNDQDRQTIVNAHNELRGKVAAQQQSGQPNAANMRKMSWDDELAKVAQMWADQCDFGHDKCRKVDRFGVGQNAYMSGTTASGGNADWKQAVNAWYNEVKDFKPEDIKPFKFSESTGHYTQVVWADSYKVGCGFAQFPKDNWNWSYYVCNYGPAGNVIGTTMYEVGKACSKCPSGASRCDNNLCA